MASNGEEARSLVHMHNPDICIMDIEMPMKSGLDAANGIKGSSLSNNYPHNLCLI